MGLSKVTTNKGEISVYQAILEGVGYLEKLVNDPKALEKAAKESFALSDAEEAKALVAKSLIAQSEAATQEAKKQQSILDGKIAEYEAIKASIDNTMDSIRKEQARLASVDAAQGKRALELDGLKVNIEHREGLLESGNRKLAQAEEALSARAAAVVRDEAALKEKANKLRGLMDA